MLRESIRTLWMVCSHSIDTVRYNIYGHRIRWGKMVPVKRYIVENTVMTRCIATKRHGFRAVIEDVEERLIALAEWARG